MTVRNKKVDYWSTNEFMKLISLKLRTYVAQICIFDSDSSNLYIKDVKNRGTIGFFEIDGNKMIITANHVLDKIKEVNSKNNNSHIFILGGDCQNKPGANIFLKSNEIINNVIDFNEDQDICTISADPSWEMGYNGFFEIKNEFFNYGTYNQSVSEDDGVIVVGFPTADSDLTKSKIEISMSCFVYKVAYSLMDRFGISTEGDGYTNIKKPNQFQTDFNPDSMSGSPVFKRKKPYNFVGILTEAPEQTIPRFICSHVNRINKFGKILTNDF